MKPYGLVGSVVVADNTTGLVDRAHEWTEGIGVDARILDLVGAGYLDANLRALASGGRLMLVGTPSGSSGALDISLVMSKRLRILGTVLRARSAEEKATATRLFARHVVPLLADGSIKPAIR